jgi:hypothetical protein
LPQIIQDIFNIFPVHDPYACQIILPTKTVIMKKSFLVSFPLLFAGILYLLSDGKVMRSLPWNTHKPNNLLPLDVHLQMLKSR